MKFSLVKALVSYLSSYSGLSEIDGPWLDVRIENVTRFPAATISIQNGGKPAYAFGGRYAQSPRVRITVYSTTEADANTYHKAVQAALDWKKALSLDEGTHLSTVRVLDDIKQSFMKAPDGSPVYVSMNEFLVQVYDTN